MGVVLGAVVGSLCFAGAEALGVVKDALSLGPGKKVRYMVELSPIAPPAAGSEFLAGLLNLGASSALREGGAAAIVCGDAELARTVCAEQREHRASKPNEAVVAVLYSGDVAAFVDDDDDEENDPLDVDGAVVQCAEADLTEAWLAETCEALRQRDIAPVLAVDAGAASKEALVAAWGAEASALGAEALVVYGGGDAIFADLLRATKGAALPVVRAMALRAGLTTADLDAFDLDAARAGAQGFDAIGLVADPEAAPRSPADVSQTLVEALAVLKSKRSRAFGGAWSSSTDAVTDTADEAQTRKWATFMQTQQKVGLMDQYRGEDDAAGAAAAAAEAPPPEPPAADAAAARQASLASLKDKGWNK